jgi:hypothetical protein
MEGHSRKKKMTQVVVILGPFNKGTIDKGKAHGMVSSPSMVQDLALVIKLLYHFLA